MTTFLNLLKIGTCLMAGVTCLTMILTDNVDEEFVDCI